MGCAVIDETPRQLAAEAVMTNIWLQPESWGDEWQEVWECLQKITEGLAAEACSCRYGAPAHTHGVGGYAPLGGDHA